MKRLILILFIILGTTCMAQNKQVRKSIREGNKEYKKEAYDKAQMHYQKALKYDSTYYKTHYNLGNSLYRDKSYAQAAQHYSKALEQATMSDKERSRILHNQGNCYLQSGLQDEAQGMQNFQKAVNSYQEALKLDPKNEDTRYNLSYAKKKLAQAQQNQQNNSQGDNNQDQNNDQQNQGDNQQNQDQQKQGGNNQDQQKQNQQNNDQQNNDQQKQDQQQQKQQQQKQQQQQKEQKKKDAERMLDAVKNNERKTMKDQQRQAAVSTGRIEKDW